MDSNLDLPTPGAHTALVVFTFLPWLSSNVSPGRLHWDLERSRIAPAWKNHPIYRPRLEILEGSRSIRNTATITFNFSPDQTSARLEAILICDKFRRQKPSRFCWLHHLSRWNKKNGDFWGFLWSQPPCWEAAQLHTTAWTVKLRQS